MKRNGKPSSVICDPYGRQLGNIRISITSRCDLDCFFCHREGELCPSGEMSAEEIVRIARIACELGMKKVKLTGGEPLLRPDVTQIIADIAPYACEVSMTTNGVRLAEYAEKLHRAGLKRVNVSLHSITSQNYRKITKGNSLCDVKSGIEAAVANHLEPVKINMVVFKGLNDNEIPQMVEFSKNCGTILQLIEFQPIQVETKHYWERFHCDLSEVETWLEAKAIRIHQRTMHLRKQYTLEDNGQTVIVEVVKPIHNSVFCKNCTRLRITSDGKLKPCLLRNDNLVDILSLIRAGKGDKALMKAFKKAISLREPYWKD